MSIEEVKNALFAMKQFKLLVQMGFIHFSFRIGIPQALSCIIAYLTGFVEQKFLKSCVMPSFV